MPCSIARTILLLLFFFVSSLAPALADQTVVFSEPGFPTPDSSPVTGADLRAAFPNAHFVAAVGLPAALGDPKTDLLVMPYGSAYPESAWPAILRYLDRGGNLLALGGKPFTRAAYREGNTWQLRRPSVAASLELYIQDYQETPGSSALTFVPNHDVEPETPSFAWAHAWSPVLKLSIVNQYNDGGGTGG